MNSYEYINGLIRNNSLAQAYIIEGNDSEERDRLVNYMIQAALCENPHEDGSPCGSCGSCIRFHAGFHEDLIFMNQSGKQQYKVEDAQDFISRMSMRAYGNRKTGVINNADRLSETVQNKLLKYIEEPEEGILLIFSLNNSGSLLPTVISRCICLMAGTSGEESFSLNRAAEGEKDFSNLINMMTGNCKFYAFRKAFDKELDGREECLDFLSSMESFLGEALKKGEDPQALSRTILLTEKCRKDILDGMSHKAGLKKLFLELH